MIIKNQEVLEKLSVQSVIMTSTELSLGVNTEDLEGAFTAGQVEKVIDAKPEEPSNPYIIQPLSAELFDQGKLIDRRRQEDRRQSFRRDEDVLLLSTAEKEAQKLMAKAQQDGFEQGLNQAATEIKQLKTAILDFTQAREEALEGATAEIASIALEVTKQILKTEVSTNPELVVSFVRQVITGAGKRQKYITLRVHPSDLSLIEKSFEDKSPVMDSVDLNLLEDATVDPGSCILETQAGQVDKRFSTQLEILERLMKKEGLL